MMTYDIKRRKISSEQTTLPRGCQEVSRVLDIPSLGFFFSLRALDNFHYRQSRMFADLLRYGFCA